MSQSNPQTTATANQGNLDQAKQLEDSLSFIRQQEQQMRKCLESKGKLLDAIKHASTLLAELRTSVLTPKQYYELYIAAFDALSYLSAFLKEDHQNHHLADIYELVQYAGNIVPRLYLMITVGTVYMSIPDAPIKEIMKDMMEMCRGVQHPIRGLFLRYYLSQGCREYLPIGTSEGPEGNLQDSIQFTITNFIEMNKLWVRLQHQGHSREREKRTKERQELQILVGSNLVRLSQLEGIDKDYYRENILPVILEQVVQCRDVIAQEYLLDVIVQVFPDDFHLYTLDVFLDATTKLNPNVSVKKIILTLVNRLADYAAQQTENGEEVEVGAEVEKKMNELKVDDNKNEDKHGDEDEDKDKDKAENEGTGDGEEDKEKEEGKDDENNKTEDTKAESQTVRGIPANINLFDVFWKHLENLLQARPDLPLQDTTAILNGILKLCLNCYPNDIEYIDKILGFAKTQTENAKSDEALSKDSISNIQDTLLQLISFYSKLLSVLNIPNYLPLLHTQPGDTQKAIATAVLDHVLGTGEKLTTTEDASGVFGLLGIIIKEGSSLSTHVASTDTVPGGSSSAAAGANTNNESSELLKDQSNLAKIVHLLYNEDPDTHAKLLSTAKNALKEGGDKIKYTYGSLITSALRLVRRYAKQQEESTEKLNSTFKFISRIISDLNNAGQGESALRLYIAAANIADQVKCEDAAYEFYTQAFTIYEEAISESKLQYQAVCTIAGALQSSRNFTSENYDTLVSKCTLYGSKLLKKPDQCRAVYLCSHLWWATEIPALDEEEGKAELFRDDKRVLECLQKALRVADACMDVAVSVELFVEILNRYVYYFDHGNTAVTVKYINGLIDLIQSNLANESEASSDSPKKHFERTLQWIETQKQHDSKFEQIVWSTSE